jgi:uncharacterized protein
MNKVYEKILLQAKKDRKVLKKTISQLRQQRKGQVDKKIHQLHREAFGKIDCLDCANCCKTTGPLFTQKDISSLAGHFNMPTAAFIAKYLYLDEDHDYVLQTIPCPFLDKDNYCTIYEVRPKACREYPHTDRVNQSGILKLTEKNIYVCPAVASIFQQLAK